LFVAKNFGEFHFLIKHQCSFSNIINRMIIPFKNEAFVKDDLAKYGYADIVHKKAEERHRSLIRCINNYGLIPVLRKINILGILTKNSNPVFSKKLNSDKKWLEKISK